MHKEEQLKEVGRKQREFILVFQNSEKEIGEVRMSLTQKYYIQRYLLTVVHVSCQNDCLASVVTYVQYYHGTCRGCEYWHLNFPHRFFGTSSESCHPQKDQVYTLYYCRLHNLKSPYIQPTPRKRPRYLSRSAQLTSKNAPVFQHITNVLLCTFSVLTMCKSYIFCSFYPPFYFSTV